MYRDTDHRSDLGRVNFRKHKTSTQLSSPLTNTPPRRQAQVLRGWGRVNTPQLCTVPVSQQDLTPDTENALL